MSGLRLIALACAGLFALLLAPPGSAQYAPHYQDAELAHWQHRYPDGVLFNLNTVIAGALPADIASAVRQIRLEFPLRAERQEPFGFASGGGTIIMSIASIKFQDDLAIANAWLQLNGYEQSTIAEYASMLKHGRLGSMPPDPLAALCIPDSALDDAAVDSLAQKLLKSAIVFILLHEVGHVLLDHPPYHTISREQARYNEAQADTFALDVLARIGDPPLGIVPFFLVAAHMAKNRGNFDSDEAYDRHLEETTHPVDALRLAAFAQNLATVAEIYAPSFPSSDGAEVFRQVAKDVGVIAETLGDRDQQQLAEQIAVSLTPRSLGPRRPQARMGLPCDFPASERDMAFHGLYGGTMRFNNVDFEFGSWMERDGDRIIGESSAGFGVIRMEGAVSGDRLSYRWSLGGDSGLGSAELQPDGTMTGTWGIGESDDDGGPWSAASR